MDQTPKSTYSKHRCDTVTNYSCVSGKTNGKKQINNYVIMQQLGQG